MTPMKDLLAVNLNDDPNIVSNELHVEKTVESPSTWHTVADNQVSSVSNEVAIKVIKVETILLDNCTPQSQNDIAECDDYTGSPSHVDVHQNTSNGGDNFSNSPCTFTENFLCFKCGLPFAVYVDLEQHLKLHEDRAQNVSGCNEIENEVLCHVCGKSFVLDFDFRKHVEEHYKNTDTTTENDGPNVENGKLLKTNSCGICGKCFALELDLDTHLREHIMKQGRVNIKLFKCDFCEKEFKLNFLLKKHVQKCHESNSDNGDTNMYEYNGSVRNELVDKAEEYDKYVRVHESEAEKDDADLIVKLKLSKSKNGVWKSKPNFVYKCKICDEKFQNEISLTEHVINVHRRQDNDKRSEDCLNGAPIFGSNNHIRQVRVGGNNFECQKCNLSFEKKENLDLHTTYCTKSSRNIWSKFLGAQNIAQVSPVVSPVGGISSTIKLRKMSDLLVSTTVIGNQSVVAPSTLTTNNRSVRVRKLKTLCSSVCENKRTVVSDAKNNYALCLNDNQQSGVLDTENTNEMNVVQIAQSDGRPHIVIKKEKNLCKAVDEIHTLNRVNSARVYETSVPEMSYDCSLRTKKEKGMNAAESNNFDPTNTTANSSECVVVTETSQRIVKREPENLQNNVVECVGRETVYFSVKETTYRRNVYYNQILEKNVLCLCKICDRTFTNIHTLALHLCSHQECSMHECVVCSEMFETVIFWSNHMAFHQQQENLLLSEVGNNSIRTEFNVTETSYVANTESQLMTIDEGSKKNQSCLRIKQEIINSHSDMSTNSSIDATESTTSCCTSTMSQQTIGIKSKSFPCTYCDRIFSGQGPLTNHEKSHTNPYKNSSLVPNVDDTLPTCDRAETNFEMPTQNTTNNSVRVRPRRIQSTCWKIKQYACRYCKKRFAKKCHRTNHMRYKHKKKLPLETLKIDNRVETNETGVVNIGEQSVGPSPRLRSITDHKNNSFISVSTDSNQTNVKTFKSKAVNCTVCQKKFVHSGYLAIHMHVHSNPFKCRYCTRKFTMKGPYTIHLMKKHNNMVDVGNVRVQSSSDVVNVVEMTEVENESRKLRRRLEPTENVNGSESIGNKCDANSNGKCPTKRVRVWYACDVCEKKYSTPSQLILHRRLLHDTVTPYNCTLCSKSYIVRHHWNKHMKSHYIRNFNIKCIKSGSNNPKLIGSASKGPNKFQCGYCKKEYSILYHWKKHFTLSKECRRHRKSNVPQLSSVKGKFECKICKKTYTTDYNRNAHMVNVHHGKSAGGSNGGNSSNYTGTFRLKSSNVSNAKRRPETDFKCRMCGNCYSTAKNLGRHVALSHSNVNTTTTCRLCGNTYKHKYSYREHCRTKHEFLFETIDGLKSNAVVSGEPATRRPEDKRKNDFCVAASSTTKKRAKAPPSPLQYECGDCFKRFETNLILGQHIIESHPHSGSSNKSTRPVENVGQDRSNKCDVCLKVFCSSSYLSQHMLTHSGLKPFKCDICNAAFRFKQNIKKHRITQHATAAAIV